MDTSVKQQQDDWAKKNGKAPISDYLASYIDNLFLPLNDEEEKQFKESSGHELEDSKKSKAKMRAVDSSSALCVNFFLYLKRNNKLDLICNALELDEGAAVSCSRFEKPYDTGTGKYKASIDFGMDLNNERSIDIESKYTEHHNIKHDSIIKQSYLDKKNEWLVRESLFSRLPFIKDFVNKWELSKYVNHKKTYIGRKSPYKYLDAAQLVRHLLGLCNQSKPFTLVYLYYENLNNKEACDTHKNEIEKFSDILKKDGIDFKYCSYQSLYNEIKKELISDSDLEYLNYLKERYVFK